MAPPKLLYLYLGRRGAMPKFALDLVRASAEAGSPAPLMISQGNELEAHFDALHQPIAKVRTFEHGAGALLDAAQILNVRRALADFIRTSRADAIVELMPHVWSPLLEDVPRTLRVPRISVLHDWRAHPGDATGLAAPWLKGSALRADRVVTLSRYVAAEIKAARPAIATKVRPLFHPDLTYPRSIFEPSPGRLKVAFLGRLFAYKGLDLCVEAVELARERGVSIELHVAGEGDLTGLQPALARLNAVVVNNWLDHAQIGAALAACDVVAATYREASQSGVVAAAFGAGRPVVATNVGALAEQVAHERTGLVAAEVSAAAVADAFVRLASDRALLTTLAANVNADAPARSMQLFAASLAEIASEVARERV